MSDVFCDVSSHLLTWPRAVSPKISVLPELQEGGNIFSGQSGDTWWWANGTEMSNISTVPDYKYLTKISQNFLNILEWKLTPQSANQWRRAVRQSWAGLSWGLSTGLKVAHHLNCVSSELNPLALLLSDSYVLPHMQQTSLYFSVINYCFSNGEPSFALCLKFQNCNLAFRNREKNQLASDYWNLNIDRKTDLFSNLQVCLSPGLIIWVKS